LPVTPLASVIGSDEPFRGLLRAMRSLAFRSIRLWRVSAFIEGEIGVQAFSASETRASKRLRRSRRVNRPQLVPYLARRREVAILPDLPAVVFNQMLHMGLLDPRSPKTRWSNGEFRRMGLHMASDLARDGAVSDQAALATPEELVSDSVAPPHPMAIHPAPPRGTVGAEGAP
jgi:hypothetical protein